MTTEAVPATSNTTVSSTTPRPGKAALWTGRILSALIAGLMIAGGVMNLMALQFAVDGAVQSGYPANVVRPLGLLAAVPALLFLIPQTSVLGAILLTAYFGGAVATHVRLADGNWYFAVIFGVLTWVALLLREPRLRTLAPIRQL